MTAKKKSKGKTRKVWYVSRFRERYELADDVYYDRKSPLLYTKDFIGSGSDDESCAYWRQLMALRSKPNWLSLRGAFAELKNVAANMSNKFRGYLLNRNFEPASEKEIGRWLGVDEKQSEQIIAELEDVGLLERVDFPKFDTEKQTDTKKRNKPRKKSQKKSTTKRKKTAAKKPKKKHARTQNSAERNEISRNPTKPAEINRNPTNPLNKNVKAKVNVKTNAKAKTNEQVDSVNSKRKNNRQRQQGCSVNSNALEGKSTRQTKDTTADCRETAVAPTTTPPIVSQSSDARGSRVIPFARTPSGSAKIPGAERLGSILQRTQHRYDADAKAFGAEVFVALKLPHEPDSDQGHRELGCFASLWTKAKSSGISGNDLDQLRERAVAEAGKIPKRGAKCRNPSAVWCVVFKRLLAAQRGQGACKAL